MHIDIEGLKQTARLILKERNINPDSESAYEVWFRHFESDTKEILVYIEEHGDILPWLYDTAEVYAEPDTNYASPAGRRVARKLIKQFS